MALVLAACGPRAGFGSPETAAPLGTTAPAPVTTQAAVVGIQSSTDRNTYIRVTFNKPMLASEDEEGEGNHVTLPHLYELDGHPLPAGTTINCRSPSCEAIQIDLPNSLVNGSAHVLRISGVADRYGVNISPDPTTSTFVVGGS